MDLTALAAAAACWCLIITVYVLTFYLIPPKSKLRYGSVAPLAVLQYWFYVYWNRSIDNKSMAPALSVISWLCYLSVCEVLVCSQVGPGDVPRPPRSHQDAKDRKSNPNLLESLSWVILLPFNLRRVGTKWAVKNTPAFSNGTPSRSAFIRQKLVRILVVYLVVDALTSGAPPEDLIDLHHQKLLSRLSEIEKGELIFRASGVLGFWITTALYNLLMTDTFMLIEVVTKIATPDQCPPLHNSFGNAWSIRQFWGVSWHQCLRKTITGVGDLFVDTVFSRTHRVSTYSRLIVAFAISGVLHHAGDMSMGIPLREAGAFFFFVFQALGIIFEDAVRGTYKLSGVKLPGAVELTIGYLWVGLFHFWITPMWMYPCARATDPLRDSLVPYTVFRKIAKAFA